MIARQEFLDVGREIFEHISTCKVCELDSDMEFTVMCPTMKALNRKASQTLARCGELIL